MHLLRVLMRRHFCGKSNRNSHHFLFARFPPEAVAAPSPPSSSAFFFAAAVAFVFFAAAAFGALFPFPLNVAPSPRLGSFHTSECWGGVQRRQLALKGIEDGD